MSSKSIVVSGLSPQVTEDQIRQFLSYCGDIEAVAFKESEAGRQAAVSFVAAESVATAELLTGAIVGDSTVTITPIVEEKRSLTRSALGVVNGVVAAGMLHGEQLVADIRSRAAKLDKENGIISTVAGGAVGAAGFVVREVRGVVKTVTGKGTLGKPTTEQWMYGNQPQWGPPPAKQ